MPDVPVTSIPALSELTSGPVNAVRLDTDTEAAPRPGNWDLRGE